VIREGGFGEIGREDEMRLKVTVCQFRLERFDCFERVASSIQRNTDRHDSLPGDFNCNLLSHLGA
jgi:hypothetical protein